MISPSPTSATDVLCGGTRAPRMTSLLCGAGEMA